MRARAGWGLVAVAAFTLAACKGGDSSSNGNPGAPTGGAPVATMTITITSSGVSPRNITVPRGSQVTFINSSSVTHEMDSNPHPAHTDCPEINQVDFLAPAGQTGSTKLTGNLNTPKTCGYHDHNRESDTTLQGTILVQ